MNNNNYDAFRTFIEGRFGFGGGGGGGGKGEWGRRGRGKKRGGEEGEI